MTSMIALPKQPTDQRLTLQVGSEILRTMFQFATGLPFSLLILGLSISVLAAESNRVKIVRIPGDGDVIKAQIGSDETVHVVFDSVAGPHYIRSIDHGSTFSAPLEIVDPASKKPGLEFHIWDIAIGDKGRVHVALGNNAWKLKLPQEQWSFHYATLPPAGKAFEPVRNLNRKPSEGYSLAANEKGDVAGTFLSGKLYAMVSSDAGKTFSPAKELNETWNPCDCCTTSAAYGGDGRLAVLYREETNNDRDMYLALWDQKNGSGIVRSRISETGWKLVGCPMTYYTIRPAKAGYIAAWPTKGEIYFARLDADGKVLPPGEIKTAGKNGMRTGIFALTADDGAALIGWKNNGKLGWQLYDATGKAQGPAGSRASKGNGAAGIALKNGTFLVLP
jgi:hypothetical protein